MKENEQQYDNILYRIHKTYANINLKQQILIYILSQITSLPVLSYVKEETLANLLDEICLLNNKDKANPVIDAALNARHHLLDKKTIMVINKFPKESIEQAILRENNDVLNADHSIVCELVSRLFDKMHGLKSHALKVLGKYFTRDREFVHGSILENDYVLAYQVIAANQKQEKHTVIALETLQNSENLCKVVDYLSNQTSIKTPELIFLIKADNNQKPGVENFYNIVKSVENSNLGICYLCFGVFYNNEYCYHTFILGKKQ